MFHSVQFLLAWIVFVTALAGYTNTGCVSAQESALNPAPGGLSEDGAGGTQVEPDGDEEKPAVTLQEAAEIQAAAIEAAAVQAGPKALSRAFRLAAKRASPSVVVVYTYGQNQSEDEEDIAEPDADEAEEDGGLPLLKRAETPTPPAPEKTDQELTGLGSGVIVSDDGLVITNHHVIARAKRVEVQLSDETKVAVIKVMSDPESDIAILRLDTSRPLSAVAVGDSDALEIGDWVLAIGSPFKLEATVSAGIISGKNRRLSRIKRGRLLQTDAAINPGNSGGPLVDLDGKVIGINTAIATRSGFYQGVGFAVPINQAKWIADELDQHGRVRRAAIGTTLVELKPRIAEKFKLPPNLGVLVYQIIKDSVAERAGFKQLDVILEFGDQRVRDLTSLQEAIERTPIGSFEKVKIQRDGKEMILEVELAPAEDPTLGGDQQETQGGAQQETQEGTSGQ
ncbi:S1C family serine protease [Stieleria varia]|uniref:Periplasmic serine endoprotease DegP n=1 Tax=Stieleria varia TaxID=2528005 RepID=A0A5C6B1I5_9BACT|nr:trypsin-like peptidase domain-containing protein [Stieleria varia]TWU05748.1 Periplasmic serine endoprotease DegP precursor [Stieleria varia]